MNKLDGRTNVLFCLLHFQILYHFNGIYAYLFVIINLLTFIYKGNQFIYPDGVLGWEVSFSFFYLIVEKVRLFQGSKGNKTEQIPPLAWSSLLSLTVVLLHAFYITEQTYVLRVDVIVNAIGLVFVALETLLAFLAGFTFYRDNGL